MWRRLSSQLRALTPSLSPPKCNLFVTGSVSSSSLTSEIFRPSVALYNRHFSSEFGNASKENEVEHGNLLETRLNVSVHSKNNRHASLTSPYKGYRSCLSQYNAAVPSFPRRFITTGATSVSVVSEDASALATPRIKFKRLDKTAKHIMQILDKEAVEEVTSPYKGYRSCLSQYNAVVPSFPRRFITTGATSVSVVSEDASALATPRIKFKRLDKTAKHIMQILDKEAVEEVRAQSEIPDIKPGYIIQLKLEVPENKRRVSTIKGIVIARRNAGLNTTFRLRRLVAGVGVENLFHLYSPNLKEIKVLDKKRVRRAKLYYLRDKMNALKKH
ncbi:hypothetical protein AABB24_021230 [Solanum stoloniferum]|uniref:Uncharacterized protein n=1 Tax=Solanum stoloniferum TaxID=62892 RepID=A0ABD2SUA5_9SOLN